MACFLAPTAEAIATTVVKKVIDAKAKKSGNETIKLEAQSKFQNVSHKLGWLTKMLWGGSFLLLVEHIVHGEVVPFFPFLTAMSSPDSTAAMLKEIATVGGSMCVAVTAVWAIAVLTSEIVAKVKKSNEKVLTKERN